MTRTEAERIHHAMWMPGLRRLYLVATAGWQAGQEGPPQMVLVNLTDAGRLRPSKTANSVEHIAETSSQ